MNEGGGAGAASSEKKKQSFMKGDATHGAKSVSVQTAFRLVQIHGLKVANAVTLDSDNPIKPEGHQRCSSLSWV